MRTQQTLSVQESLFRIIAEKQKEIEDHDVLDLLFRPVVPDDLSRQSLIENLLATFNSIGGCILATDRQLRLVPAMNDSILAVLGAVRISAFRAKAKKIDQRPVFKRWSVVEDYLISVLGHDTDEHFRVLYLDPSNRLIADKKHVYGDAALISIDMRGIVRQILDTNASGIILAHNHLSGDPTPTEGDVIFTRNMLRILIPLSVTLHDHIIVGYRESRSMRKLGLISQEDTAILSHSQKR
jgi:DNA repair protein RadC